MKNLLVTISLFLLCYGLTIWAGTPVNWILFVALIYLVGKVLWWIVDGIWFVGPAPSKELRQKQREALDKLMRGSG